MAAVSSASTASAGLTVGPTNKANGELEVVHISISEAQRVTGEGSDSEPTSFPLAGATLERGDCGCDTQCAAIAFGTQDAAPVPQLDSTGESEATANSSNRGWLQWLRAFTPKVPMVGAEGVLEEQLAVPTQQPVPGVHYFRHTIPTFWRHPNPDTAVELAAHRAPAPLAPELPPDPWLQTRDGN